MGGVWYKRRQDNRPLPPYLMNQDNNDGDVEMGGTTGVQTHATANKWKSAWELKQKTKAQAQGGNQYINEKFKNISIKLNKYHINLFLIQFYAFFFPFVFAT